MWSPIRLLDATLPTVAENLALDEALLIDAEDHEGPAVLRIWELDHFAVVMGASDRLLQNVRLDACRLDDVALGRRSSGGGTVVIGPGALNVSVVLPIAAASELKGVDTAQGFVLGRTAGAIRAAGPAVEVLGSGDLTLGGRKFSGSAQRRLRHQVLIHASLLYDFPLDRIDRYTLMPPRRPVYRGDRPHGEFVTNLPLDRPRLVSALLGGWLLDPSRPELATVPEPLVRSLVATKFSLASWIERL